MAILLVLSVLAVLQGMEDKPFKKVTLSENNLVTNYTRYPYLDTIAYVGLDELGLCDITLEIKKLSKEAQQNMPEGYDFRGLIYGSGNQYTMWVNDAGRKEHTTIVAHELIHLRQYYSKQLIYDGFYVYWNRAKYDLKEIDYGSRPWEAEAFEQEVILERAINSKLY
jgi:hypothetical protein